MNHEIIDNIINSTKDYILTGMWKFYQENDNLIKENKQECDRIEWLNKFVRSELTKEYDTDIRKIFIKLDEFTNEWEVIIIYNTILFNELVIHIVFESTCIVCLEIKSITIFKKTKQNKTIKKLANKINY